MASGIRFGLNGRHVALDVDRDRTLLSILRTDLELTGAKYGCARACAEHAPCSSTARPREPARPRFTRSRARKSSRSKGLRPVSDCIPCSRPSSITARSSAATARQGCCSRHMHCCAKLRNPRERRSWRTWNATCVVAAPTSASGGCASMRVRRLWVWASLRRVNPVRACWRRLAPIGRVILRTPPPASSAFGLVAW